MTFSMLTATILPGGMLILTLLLISRMRLASMVSLFRLQSIFLGAYALVLGIEHDEASLIAVALILLATKAMLIPYFLTWAARKNAASERLTAYVRPTMLSFIGVLVTGGAFYMAQSVASVGEGYLIVAVSFALIMLGIVSLIARTDMFGQGIGFLIMESGVFTFGLALMGGMPILVEVGALIDVLALFTLMVLLVGRAQREHKSVATDRLKALID